MPKNYFVECECGYNAKRYRNVKRCPDCGGLVKRRYGHVSDKALAYAEGFIERGLISADDLYLAAPMIQTIIDDAKGE